MTFLLKPPMMKRRSQLCRRVNRKVKKVMKNTRKSYTYTSADKKFTRKWHTKKERGVSGKAARQNILRGTEGPRGRAKTVKMPAEGFELFITDEMMQDIVNNTNKNIRNFMTRFHDELKESSKYSM